MSTDTDEGVVVSLRLPREELTKHVERLAYSEREAADLLGISYWTLRELRIKGKVKARRMGRSFIYSRKALEQFVDGEDA